LIRFAHGWVWFVWFCILLHHCFFVERLLRIPPRQFGLPHYARVTLTRFAFPTRYGYRFRLTLLPTVGDRRSFVEPYARRTMGGVEPRRPSSSIPAVPHAALLLLVGRWSIVDVVLFCGVEHYTTCSQRLTLPSSPTTVLAAGDARSFVLHCSVVPLTRLNYPLRTFGGTVVVYCFTVGWFGIITFPVGWVTVCHLPVRCLLVVIALRLVCLVYFTR